MKIFMDNLQTTLAIIKPDGMARRKAFHKKIIKSGYRILQKKIVTFSPEQAAEFFKEYEKAKYFMLMVLNLSKGPSEVLILCKENAVLDFISFCVLSDCHNEDCHLQCIECMHCMFGEFENDYKRPIHGSIGHRNAKRELNFVFPNFIVDDFTEKFKQTRLFCDCNLMKQFVEGLFSVTEKVYDNPITGLAKILKAGNPNLPIVSHSDEDSFNKAIQTIDLQGIELERVKTQSKTSSSSSTCMHSKPSTLKPPSSCILCSTSSSSSSTNIPGPPSSSSYSSSSDAQLRDQICVPSINCNE